MKSSWRGRQLIALLLLAVVLVLVAGFLQLMGAVRQAIRQAQVEADLITASVRGEIVQIVQESKEDPAAAIAENPRLDQALRDAIVMAPSILSACVLDPDGAAIAHTQAGRVGSIEPVHAALPSLRSPGEGLRILWQLRNAPPTYQKETALDIGERPLAVIRVSAGGPFLRDAVRAAASRGIWIAVVGIGFAVGAGILLARFAAGQLLVLEKGIASIRDGAFEALPESGVDEFARLARAVNLLGARLARDSSGNAEKPGDGEASAEDRAAMERAILEGRSRAVAHLGEVAAGMAHEMRNQLQAVEGEIRAVRIAADPASPAARRSVENAAARLEQLDGAVRGFLKIAGIQPPVPRAIDLNAFLRSIATEFRTEVGLAGVDLEVDLDPDDPQAFADPEVLRQAMQNLIRNSLRALVDAEDGKIILRSTRRGDYVQIAVRDNGPGIPPEVREKMFDLFYTTRSDGTGVGLMIVRQSIEMQAGAVEIQSAPGGGTEVVMELPCG